MPVMVIEGIQHSNPINKLKNKLRYVIPVPFHYRFYLKPLPANSTHLYCVLYKEYNVKLRGFLLVEVMIGLLVSTLCMVIITHYIIEVKSSQQKALEKIESFSTGRNEVENSAIDCTKSLSKK